MEENRSRFKKKITKDIRDHLKRFILNKGLIEGNGKVTLPWIDIPRFKYENLGGVAQGEGDVGGSLNPAEPILHQGLIETDVTIDDVAEMLAEEIGLPFQKPREGRTLDSERYSYEGVSRKGRIKLFSRTFRRALRREMTSGSYDFDNPVVVPEKDDWVYRQIHKDKDLTNQAVLIFMMDVSNSMGEQQRRICRVQNKWAEVLIKKRYPAVDIRRIIHSSAAEETDEHGYYHTYQAGATLFSSAYEKCLEIMAEYPPEAWDVYPFHFSDGGNWKYDNDKAIFLLRNQILPKSNQFCYGQCFSEESSDESLFLDQIVDEFFLRQGTLIIPKLRLARINSIRDHIPVLRTFLNEKAHPLYNVID